MNDLLTAERVMRYLRIDDVAERAAVEAFVAAAVAYAKAYQKQDWPDGLPEYTQVACLMAVAQWWEHRDGLAPDGASGLELPEGVKALLDLDRIRMVGGV